MTEQTTNLSTIKAPGQVFNLQDVKRQTAAIHGLFSDVLKDGTHYGIIPGTPKPTLYKPGAEKIGLLLHLAPSFQRQMQYEGAHLTVISECVLTSQVTGVVLASAGAMCSSKETKYAYRQATRKCPKCGKPSIIKGKREYGGGWICFDKKGGCKAKWPDGATEIEGQSEEREDNPNLADVYNTVMKMADKRAYVAATLFGTAASDIFTQDIEDFRDEETSSPQPHIDPAHATADELEGHMQDMEEAFQRGEGPAWWAANAKPIIAELTPEQRKRFFGRKNELKEAHGTAGVDAPQSAAPPAAEADAAPAPLDDEREVPQLELTPYLREVEASREMTPLKAILIAVRTAWGELPMDPQAVVAIIKEKQKQWGKELGGAQLAAYGAFKKEVLAALKAAGLPHEV
jgi:hypothetical protein